MQLYIFLLHMAVRMWRGGGGSSPVTISGYPSPVMHFYFYFYFHLATTAATPLELLHYYTSTSDTLRCNSWCMFLASGPVDHTESCWSGSHDQSMQQIKSECMDISFSIPQFVCEEGGKKFQACQIRNIDQGQFGCCRIIALRTEAFDEKLSVT